MAAKIYVTGIWSCVDYVCSELNNYRYDIIKVPVESVAELTLKLGSKDVVVLCWDDAVKNVFARIWNTKQVVVFGLPEHKADVNRSGFSVFVERSSRIGIQELLREVRRITERSPRKKCAALARLTRFDGNGSEALIKFVRLLDISDTGAAFVVDQPLKSEFFDDLFLSAHIFTDKGIQRVKKKIKIVRHWNKNGHCYAARFLSLCKENIRETRCDEIQ